MAGRKSRRNEHAARKKREPDKNKREVTDLSVLHKLLKSLKNGAGFGKIITNRRAPSYNIDLAFVLRYS